MSDLTVRDWLLGLGAVAAVTAALIGARAVRNGRRSDRWVSASDALRDLATAYMLVEAQEQEYTSLIGPEQAMDDAVDTCAGPGAQALRENASAFIAVGRRFASQQEGTGQEELAEAKEAVAKLIRARVRHLH